MHKNKLKQINVNNSNLKEFEGTWELESYELLIETLAGFSGEYDTLEGRYQKAIEIVEEEVVRRYGVDSHNVNQVEIQSQLFQELEQIISDEVQDNLLHIWEIQKDTVREIVEYLYQPYQELDALKLKLFGECDISSH